MPRTFPVLCGAKLWVRSSYIWVIVCNGQFHWMIRIFSYSDASNIGARLILWCPPYQWLKLANIGPHWYCWCSIHLIENHIYLLQCLLTAIFYLKVVNAKSNIYILIKKTHECMKFRLKCKSIDWLPEGIVEALSYTEKVIYEHLEWQ